MSNAWKKGFETWRDMNAKALDESESVRPRFEDFKVYANAEHHTAGFTANLLPRGYTNFVTNQALPGEWSASKVVIPKTDGTDGVHNREVIATGSSYPGAGATLLGAVSLIEGYAASRALPYSKDPNTPGDADSTTGNSPQNWMAATFNEGTSQSQAVLNDATTENNEAPYPFEGDGQGTADTMYPGGANQLPGLELHDFEIVSSTTVGRTTRLRGGVFPCGIISLGTSGFADATSLIVQVDLVPGDHRGYMCTPMMEM
jgi:hypothetical protein